MRPGQEHPAGRDESRAQEVASRRGGMQAVIDARVLMSSQSSGSLIRSELD